MENVCLQTVTVQFSAFAFCSLLIFSFYSIFNHWHGHLFLAFLHWVFEQVSIGIQVFCTVQSWTWEDECNRPLDQWVVLGIFTGGTRSRCARKEVSSHTDLSDPRKTIQKPKIHKGIKELYKRRPQTLTVNCLGNKNQKRPFWVTVPRHAWRHASCSRRGETLWTGDEKKTLND